MENETKQTSCSDANIDAASVLLIEDDVADISAVNRILANSSKFTKFRVESAGSLSEALEYLTDKEYDVVLADLGLPDSKGLETVQKLKQVASDTPIVVLTGLSDQKTGILAIEAGAVDFLAKSQPLSKILVRTLSYALARKKAEGLILETNRRLQETSHKLSEAKQNLEKKNRDLEKAHEELEKRVEQRTAELSIANKALQATETNLRNMIKQNADGIFVVDKDGITCFVNPVACSLFGRKPEELIGKVFEFPAVVGKAVEIEILREDGEQIVAEMQTSESEWESKNVKLISLRNITQRKLMENKLKEANERLQEFNHLKDEFVSTISHELRTPLSITTGAIRLLLDEVSGPIADEQRKVLTTAMENIRRLGNIVESLLSISVIESGKIELQKKVINICKLVKDTVADYKTLAQKKAVSLYCEVPEQDIDIRLDPDRTREILINLISNSIKFTPKGGWIKVTCRGQEQEVQICVQDSGIGIAKDDIPKSFDKFTQFGRKNGPGEKGTGLGLAIVKKLTELHSGKVEVESEVNQGTTFTISLPLTAEAAAENPPAEVNELVENTTANS